MDIDIVSTYEHRDKPITTATLIIDGKKKTWRMARGLWSFVQDLIENQKES